MFFLNINTNDHIYIYTLKYIDNNTQIIFTPFTIDSVIKKKTGFAGKIVCGDCRISWGDTKINVDISYCGGDVHINLHATNENIKSLSDCAALIKKTEEDYDNN